MNAYDDTTYGQRIAGVYDDLYSEFDPTSIEVLAELAQGGLALELGIGTGRIALPLQEKGLTVQGIDASEAMISKLRSKPRGDEIDVLLGSFANFQLEKRFNLIYVVFNTFFALLTQAEQVQCFKSVARHLAPGGKFLIEVFVPNLSRFTDRQTVRAINLDEHHTNLEVSRLDLVLQQVTTQHVLLSEAGIQLYPVKIRYAWPAELDLMAQIAGLSLLQRWDSWSRAAFTGQSQKHISVYAPEN